jgi:hypothetical protein
MFNYLGANTDLCIAEFSQSCEVCLMSTMKEETKEGLSMLREGLRPFLPSIVGVFYNILCL